MPEGASLALPHPVSLETSRYSLQAKGRLSSHPPPRKGKLLIPFASSHHRPTRSGQAPRDPRPFDSRSRGAQDRPEGAYFRSNDERNVSVQPTWSMSGPNGIVAPARA